MSISRIIYNGWQAPARVLVIGILAYLALLIILRASGKRSLSKMNAFDLIVTIAVGSTFANALLSRNVALAEAVTAFALLIGLQLVVTWLSVRSKSVSRLVKSEPALLLYRGQFLPDVMRREHVTEGEVLAAIREHGAPSVENVHAVVIETTGELSVLPDNDAPSSKSSALDHVANVPPSVPVPRADRNNGHAGLGQCDSR